MFSAGTLATILTILRPLIEPFLNALGRTFNDYIAGERAAKNAQELGRKEAELGAAKGTIEAQGAELDALANAPKDTDEAIKRLEGGTA